MLENKIYIRKNIVRTLDTTELGQSGENNQQKLVFIFEDGFIDGTAFLEVVLPTGDKKIIELEKESETYYCIVKNSLLISIGTVKMQLKIIKDTSIWKSQTFEMSVSEAINASEALEDDYLDTASKVTAKIQEIESKVDNLDYNNLLNRPKIEGITLEDNKSFDDLGIRALTNTEIENLLKD